MTKARVSAGVVFLATASVWSAEPTGRSPVAILLDHTLSSDGVNVATAYAMSNKIVTTGDHTYVSWLDGPSTVRIQVFDHATGDPGGIADIGKGDDNHGGPALTVDRKGNLHIVYGPHHSPFQYRRTMREGDIRSWSPVIRFGRKCTYPSLVCGPDDTLHLTCRGGNTPCGLHYYRKHAEGPWTGPVVLADADVPDGYTQFGNALTITDDGVLHLAFHFYEVHPAAGKAVAYMRSPDGGKTWTDTKGRKLSLPVTPKTAELVEAGPPLDMRVSNVVCDGKRRPFFMVSHLETAPPHGVLWRHDGSRWRKTSLAPWVRKTIGPYGQTSGGTLSFADDGRLYIALLLTKKAEPWSDVSTEVGLLTSADGGESFTGQMLSPPDPNRPNWLPSLERCTGHHRVDMPWLVYTHGPKDEQDRLAKKKFEPTLVALTSRGIPAGARTVRVGGIVLKWTPKDREKSFQRAEAMIREAAAAHARIVCTTESFLDGYSIRDKAMPLAEYRALAEEIPGGPYVARLQGLARELKIYLIAGLLERAGEKTHNAAAVIGPDGALLGVYRKQHLGHERVRNTPGDQCPTFPTPYGRMGVMICADRRYPEVTAGLVKNGADFLIVPSGGMWGPKSNDKHLRKRSSESKLPIVFVHPIEFLVTGPGGIIWDRDFRGHEMDVTAEQIETAADQKGMFLFDLPIRK